MWEAFGGKNSLIPDTLGVTKETKQFLEKLKGLEKLSTNELEEIKKTCIYISKAAIQYDK